jgi:hypothetical protein
LPGFCPPWEIGVRKNKLTPIKSPIKSAANGGTDGSAQPNGLFQMNTAIRLKNVKDGLSNTFAVGERGSFVVQNAWVGAMGDGRGGVEVLALALRSGPGPVEASPSGFCGPHATLSFFVMADGSVHPIKAAISPVVYQALSTRSGREVIDQGAY